MTELLASALDGDNTCASCGGAVPITAQSVAFVRDLHDAGELANVAPEGVRMLLLLGSVEAGCGLAADPDSGRPRVSCRDCATPAQLQAAAAISRGFGGGHRRFRRPTGGAG